MSTQTYIAICAVFWLFIFSVISYSLAHGTEKAKDRGRQIVLPFLILVSLTTVACLSFRSKGVGSEANPVITFTPNPLNDKVILVKGWNEVEIQKIINDFIKTYQSDGYPSYSIEPHKQEADLFRLTFPQDVHPRLFTFLINYLAYPFDIDLKNRTVIVGGKTTLSAAFDGVDSSVVGKKAILYIPHDDQDHDVVYMQTESGINLANSFTEMRWRRVNEARLSSATKNLIGGV